MALLAACASTNVHHLGTEVSDSCARPVWRLRPSCPSPFTGASLNTRANAPTKHATIQLA